MHCKNCKHRDEKGYCLNEKVSEEFGQDGRDDSLIYDYQESGGFQVGDNFGCVHFRRHDATTRVANLLKAKNPILARMLK